MRRNGAAFFCAVWLLTGLLCYAPRAAAADQAAYGRDTVLSIATMDSRPLTVDRLVYAAFKDIGLHAEFAALPLQTGHEMAGNGERDGVITLLPDMESLYPDARKVPVVLENTLIYAVVREDSPFVLEDWEDVKGLSAGVLPQRTYIEGKLWAHEVNDVTAKENNSLLLDGLLAGEYDTAILSRRAHEQAPLPEGLTYACLLDTMPEYLYLHKRHEWLIPALTATLTRIFADGRGDSVLDGVSLPDISERQTILHIFSAHGQMTREEELSAALRAPFEDDTSIEWYTMELNARRWFRAENRLSYYANLLRQDCVSKNIAAVVVSGDDALRFVKDYYHLFFLNTPVLFYGIIEDYDTAVQGFEPYFTGVLEKLSVAETLSEALRLFPDTQKIYVVNDYTTEGVLYRQAVQRQLAGLPDAPAAEYNEDIDCGALLTRLRTLPKDTLVFVGSYFCDVNGQYYSLKEMERLLERSCARPTFSVHSTAVEYGALGGKCLDYDITGRLLSGMLSRLLEGDSPSSIPVVSDPAVYSRWVFDKNVTDAWGIWENELPEGTQLLGKTPSIWESDPRFASALVALCVLGITAAVVISFFMLRHRRQRELLANEEKIRIVKERLERIINTAPVAFMLTIDGVVVDANEYMRRHTGVQKGDPALRLYADRSQRDELTSAAIQQELVENHVIWCHMPDKSRHRFLANVSTVDYEGRTGFIFWAMDTEERERQKDQMQAAHQNLQTLLDTLPVAVRITELGSAAAVYANQAALKLFGCSTLEELSACSELSFMPEIQPDGQKTADRLAEMNHGGRTVAELRCKTRGGAVFDARFTSCVIEYKGRMSCLSILEDLTAEKDFLRMLRDTAEKEREANQLKSRFLVNMSHEIRTPMNAIIGLTEIELHKPMPDTDKEVYRKINISAKNLLDIINDILDLSKIEADKMELYEDEFELEDVLNSALLVASPRLEGKNVEFLLNASLALPRYLVGDRTRLWQVLKNFLDNAAKYTEAGKIVLTVFAQPSQSDDQTIVLTFIVEDTGIGIDEQQMKKLFLPYEQVRNDAQKRYSGTGLGLAISKQLCQMMGGDLQVDSSPGQGTTVIISLPFRRAASQETETDAVRAEVLAGLRFLAVDDDELSLHIMRGLLENSSAQCVLAKSGMEAMEIILAARDRGEAFDVILLDYKMEGLDGLETARQIHTALSKAPKLLMVTAYQRMLLKRQIEESGIDDIIEKPFLPSQFIRKLCAVLGYTEQARGQERAYVRFQGVTVLLCEDYRLNQEVAAGMLAQFGVKTEVAENGRQAVEWLRQGKTYDLIFMDLQMPVMDGYEATRIIRADRRFDRTPIISLTADAMKEITDKCLEMGMNDHVAKPMEFDSLYRVLLKWLPAAKQAGKVFSGGAAPGSPGSGGVFSGGAAPGSPGSGGVFSGGSAPAENGVHPGLARFGSDQELFDKALAGFAEELPEKWPDFDAAVQDGEQTGRFVHKLKGASGNLGEMEIYRLSEAFERSLREGAPDKALYEQLAGACGALKAQIRRKEAAREAASPSGEQGTAGELTALLERLRDACENFNPAAGASAVKALRAKEWPLPPDKKEKLRHIEELARKYEFDAALEALADWRTEREPPDEDGLSAGKVRE